MTFSMMGWGGVFAGLAALGAALFVLQRLQVRHRDVVVPTTMFWREAVEQARARVLFQRFRHPWAFVLACAIAACLWLGFAGPTLAGVGDREHVVLVDGSAAAAHAGRWDAVRAALDRELGDLPSDRTVVLCGAAPRTVLAPGEHPALLRARLDGLAPAASSPAMDRELSRLRGEARERPLTVTWLGDTAPPEGVGGDVEVRWVAPEGAPRPNAGIFALGMRHAASGVAGAVDVLVDVGGAVELAGRTPTVAVDGEPLGTVTARQRDAEEGDAGGRQRFAVRDVPARGGLLEVSLQVGEGDGLPLDDRATLRLPDLAPIRVALGDGVPGALATALAADASVQWADAGGEVDLRVGLEGALPPGDGPALVLATAATGHAFVLVTDDERAADRSLRDAVAALGLDQLDGAALAEETRRPITVGLERGAPRELRLWQALFAADLEFARTRALPVVVANGVRWLVGRPPLVPFAAAGEPLLGALDGRSGGSWVDGEGRLLDPLGARFEPPTAGVFAGDEFAVAASLLSPAVTEAGAGRAMDVTPAAVGGGSGDVVTWLALLALCLLAAEWFFYRTGRMP